jgi:N,N'-diacetylchitobiose transport system permease protein
MAVPADLQTTATQAVPRPTASAARRRRRPPVTRNVLGVLFSLVMIFPVYWMVNTAFKPENEVLTFTPQWFPSHPTLDNFWAALHAHNFVTDLTNGLTITAVAVAVGLVEGFLGALAIARFRFYGRRAVILVIVTVQMIPTVSLLIPLYLTLDHVHLTNSLTGIIITYQLVVLPFTVWVLRGFIVGIPRQLDEAALVDGCSQWQVFMRIILPLTGPGLVAAGIFGVIQTWNEFIIIDTLNDADKWNLMAWLMSNQTLRGTSWGTLMAGATLTSLPVVVLFLIIQRHIATGLTAGAVKG